jgi:type IV secretory pathway VirJ component
MMTKMPLRRPRRRTAIVIATILAIAALLVGVFGWLGAWNASPFVDMPARENGNHHYAAVLLSGDMGLRAGLGGELASRLADHGIATVGVNSLNYFKVRRTPEDVSTMLAEAIRRAMALGHTDRVIVLGQSFGSDMVHVGLEHLPADLRRHVSMVVLTVPTRTVFLRVSPLEWLDETPPDAPALASASKLGWVPVVCIHGQDEPESLCPLLHLPRLTQIVLPGDHYLNKDADRLFGAIRGVLAAHTLAGPETAR